ncbi:Flavin-dependent oxidoreductase, luciferase family (includes alkanesulfonate monooxygenase SsuD and methylene tetrahydromethanopterin reductase) [Thermomonospora echinospora]|uniref:Flavin-dependent oxidoreductase, luciferase family (Includes alkanesulfonate monooxygenase SsuD and methylene tetrahydromethanopterin reductase) n=1 Tax=Thermomonospora echinospora TaxID=1992 RepID=A0A1H6ANM2_9ACTN|nr:LLM class flavin-dependent oxidoreductase [Thermomonospora echinospora]SEG49667.1 Flavin-dependent oxidoreductase, luciferase family (includes alkanesulfonate monooxygenase SsuD and methylene tetrahydromethanopterin reductase) [Thermomonospora echinospora]
MSDMGSGPPGGDTPTCEIGLAIQADLLTADGTDLAAFGRAVLDAGLGYVSIGDHVSHRGGQGLDGIVAATALLAAQPRLRVVVGAYQLALRHPFVVARQLATLTALAPRRLILAVGAGGDDRREVLNCGVDPRTRGDRLNESIALLHRLLAGENVDHHGTHFDLEQAFISDGGPPPDLVVAGRGEAASKRAARFGTGWLGLLVTPGRYHEMRTSVVAEAEALGRPTPTWFGLNVWCAPAENERESRERLAESLTRSFGSAADRALRYCGVGDTTKIASWLAGYVHAGAAHLSLTVPARHAEEAVERAHSLATALAEHVQSP